MSTDNLLSALAKAARTDEIEEDPRWAALVEGRLSGADREALEELAARDARHEEALHLLSPLSDEARERITDRILSSMRAAPAPEAPAKVAPAQVIPLSAWRRWTPLIAAASLAAGVVLSLSVATTTSRRGAPLPPYELALLGGERETRADPGARDARAPVVLGPGSSLDLTLRPATPVQDPIEVRAFLLRSGHAERWSVRAESSAAGASRIQGEREALFPPGISGPVEIVIAVGRPGSLPDAAAVERGDPSPGVQIFRRQVVLTAPHP